MPNFVSRNGSGKPSVVLLPALEMTQGCFSAIQMNTVIFANGHFYFSHVISLDLDNLLIEGRVTITSFLASFVLKKNQNMRILVFQVSSIADSVVCISAH